MSNLLPLTGQLAFNRYTLSPADLLLNKLQVVELNENDVLDTCTLLAFPLSPTDENDSIALRRIMELTADDWGFSTRSIGTPGASRGTFPSWGPLRPRASGALGS